MKPETESTMKTAEANNQQLVSWISRWGGFATARSLVRNSSRYHPGGAAEKALQGLVDAGLARWIDKPSGVPGGHPIRGVELISIIEPTIDRPDRPTDQQEIARLRAVLLTIAQTSKEIDTIRLAYAALVRTS